MCLLFETIRIKDGILCHPGYHQIRMDHARTILFPESTPLNISEIVIPDTAKSGIFKCRIVYDREFREVEFLPYTPKQIRTIRLVEAGDLTYPFKYNDRSGIEKLKTHHRKYDEIILVQQGCITDTSYSNLAFLSGKRWFTPSVPLLNGTCRQRLIDQGTLIPIQITLDSLSRYSHISLINAMLDLEDIIFPIDALEF